jgi:hypothetical protein
MGQFSNQPDFATAVETVSAFPAKPAKPSAIYIGTAANPATITVVCVDGNSVTFTGIASGSFLPVVVTEITSAVSILAADILFIR